jgi:hypothetical protein
MAKDNKKFHQKAKVILDLQALRGMEAIQQLSSEIDGYCTYDCWYVDCGYSCPEDSSCHKILVEMCNKLNEMELDEEDFDYPLWEQNLERELGSFEP